MSITVHYIDEYPSETIGGRLGRHHESDSRSLAYLFAAEIPVIQSVRHIRNIPILDQGNLRACTGFAAEGIAGIEPFYTAIPVTNPTDPSAHDITIDNSQAVALYSEATKLDKLPGSFPPDDTGSTGLAVAKAMRRSGLISGYQHVMTLNDMLAALQITPLLFGTNWYSSFDMPDANGLVRITPSAYVRGGHEICADEVDAVDHLVGFTNSWSESWGLNGRFYLSWTDLERLLAENGDVIVPAPVTSPAPIPTPQPAPDEVDRAMWQAAQTWARAKTFIS